MSDLRFFFRTFLAIVLPSLFLIACVRSYWYPEKKSFRWMIYSVITFMIEAAIFDLVCQGLISYILGSKLKVQ